MKTKNKSSINLRIVVTPALGGLTQSKYVRHFND